jgi:FPC/CPF motif-containing protein YcgG
MSINATDCRNVSDASDWTARLILGNQFGAAQPPEWVGQAYMTFRTHVLNPDYPCFFGTQAERLGDMFYSFVTGRDIRHLPSTMANFVRRASHRKSAKHNLAVFFEPESSPPEHDLFRALSWEVLQYLHDHDVEPTVPGAALEPTDVSWEFCFAATQMFVVGCSPTYLRRRSRNLGAGAILLFQPRSVFVDAITKRDIGADVRTTIRDRLSAWDSAVAHPDLGTYGDAAYREWKQYFLPDNDAPETGVCPFSTRDRGLPSAPRS